MSVGDWVILINTLGWWTIWVILALTISSVIKIGFLRA